MAGKVELEIKTGEPMTVSSVVEDGDSIKIAFEIKKEDKPSVKPLPTIKPSLIGDKFWSKGQIQFRSLAKGADGQLYAAGYFSNSFAQVDPENDRAFELVSTKDISVHAKKWVGSETAGNGLTYFFPNFAPGYLIFDPSTKKLETSGGAYQIRAGAYDQETGKIFSPQYGGAAGDTGRMRWIDTAEDKTGVIRYDIDRSGPIYQARQEWEKENERLHGIYDRYWGHVAHPNGKQFSIPFGSDKVLVTDPKTMTVTQGLNYVTGVAPLYDGPLNNPFLYDSPYLYKYNDGCVSSLTGEIVAMPRHALGILFINPEDGSAEEIPLPEDLTAGFHNRSKTFHTFEGPDGRIYGTPWQMPFLIWIDPVTKEIGWFDLSDFLEGTGAKLNWFTYAQVVGNSVYLAPGASNYFAKIEFS